MSELDRLNKNIKNHCLVLAETFNIMLKIRDQANKLRAPNSSYSEEQKWHDISSTLNWASEERNAEITSPISMLMRDHGWNIKTLFLHATDPFIDWNTGYTTEEYQKEYMNIEQIQARLLFLRDTEKVRQQMVREGIEELKEFQSAL